jgi:SPP1 family predicted phage head-tail adaptor
MYYPGDLDQLITIKRETRAADGMGGGVDSLTTIASDLFAHVRPRSGKEMGIHDKVEAPALYLFVIRYRDDLREDDRIEWNGQQYNIRAILSRGARELYLDINAERSVTM